MDNKLKCSAVSCMHNFNELCGAAMIQVRGSHTMNGENTFCNTYAVRNLSNHFANMTNMNIIEDAAPVFASDTMKGPRVACTAKNCTYNQDYECRAEVLHIQGDESAVPEQTACQTFVPKS